MEELEKITPLLESGNITNIELGCALLEGLGISSEKFIFDNYDRYMKYKDVKYNCNNLKKSLMYFYMSNVLDIEYKDLIDDNEIILEFFNKFPHIQFLWLSGYSNHIPQIVSKFKGKCLTLFQGDIEHIPEWIGEMTTLKSLTIFKQKITDIPDSISNLQQLELFDLRDSCLSIEKIEHLKTLLPNCKIYT